MSKYLFTLYKVYTIEEQSSKEKEFIKERIKYLTEQFKQFFTLFLLLSSGFTTLIIRALGKPNNLELIFIILGILIIVPNLRRLFALNIEIESLINELKN